MTTTQHHEANRNFYDRISEAYDFIADSNERLARLAGIDALDPRPGENALELGFGTGNEVIDLAKLVGPTGLVAGIDVSPGMLNVAKRKIDAAGLTTPLDLRVADARQLPFDDNTFDLAYSSFTLELFAEDDIPVVLREARRVLKPGGRLGVVSMATVKTGDRASFLERTYVWMHRHFPHIVDCRPIDVPAVVSAAGFDLSKTRDLEIWTMPVGVVVGRKQ